MPVLQLTLALFVIAAPAEPTASVPAPVAVSVGRETVFDVGAPSGAASAEERAHAAQSLLDQVVQDADAPAQVTLEPLPAVGAEDAGGSFALRVDGREVFRVAPADVAHSGLTAEVYGQSLRATTQMALQRERRHVAQQRLLESISLVVFLGLLLFLALRGVREGALRARATVEAQLAKMRGLRLGAFELLSPEALEGASYVLVGLGRVLLQLGLFYLYLVFVLTRFAGSRALVAPLNHALAEPFGKLAGRVVELFPIALLALCSVLVVLGALRLADFFLSRVASGEFQWRWLPRDLAPALSPLVRGAIVVVALLLFGPLIGSEQDQLFTRVGLLLLGGVGLSLVPLSAAVMVGVVAIVGRRYRTGEWVAIGDVMGEVTEVDYLGVSLVPTEAGRLWVPHLLTLWVPVRHLPGPPVVDLEIPLDPRADPKRVVEVLGALVAAGKKVEARLVRLTPGVAHYALRLPSNTDASVVLQAAWTALVSAGLSPGAKAD